MNLQSRVRLSQNSGEREVWLRTLKGTAHSGSGGRTRGGCGANLGFKHFGFTSLKFEVLGFMVWALGCRGLAVGVRVYRRDL